MSQTAQIEHCCFMIASYLLATYTTQSGTPDRGPGRMLDQGVRQHTLIVRGVLLIAEGATP